MGLDHHRGGSGAPLLLIHGIGHTWGGWKPMLPQLKERFDVLAVDLPGCVRARAPRAGRDRHRDLARRAPAPKGEGLGRGRAPRDALAGPQRTGSRAAASKPRHPLTPGRAHTAGRPWRKDPDELIEESECSANCVGFEAALPHTFHAQPRGLTTLDVPVLILWGTLDIVLIPRQGRRFERLIPGAELRYIRGIGHVPMADAPEELAEAITDFALDRSRRPVAQAAAAGS